MIGPSSSHTAGACRIGYTAKNIIKLDILDVEFTLYGSFAKTYKGHGTDLALLGGFLGFKPDDVHIKNAFELANARGLSYHFTISDDEVEHPNSVLIKAKTKELTLWEIFGESIGGGMMIIKSINGIQVEYTGAYNTLVIHHIDNYGMISKISTKLSENRINIANMKLYREEKGKKAIAIIETDELIDIEILLGLQKIDGTTYVNAIDKLYE